MRKCVAIWFVAIWLLSTTAALAQDSLFAPAVNYAVGITPCSVIAADLDDDGDNDLAVANDTSYSVSVLMGNGDGTFRAAVDYAVDLFPRAVAAGDLDGDGDLDLATANLIGDISVLRNNGNGTFIPAVNDSTIFFSEGLAIADLDADGDKDLAVVSPGNPFGSGYYSILINDGDGTFQPAVVNGASQGACSVVATDLDGDGDNDLAVAIGSIDGNVSIFRNNGHGTFQGLNYPTAMGSFSVFATDFDGDGDKDLVTANYFSNNVSILFNNGDATFQAAVNYPAGGGPISVFADDFDRDGDNDLAMVNATSNNVSMLMNNGSGVFQGAGIYGVGGQPFWVFAADLDDDNGSDLAVVNSLSNNVSVLINRTLVNAVGDEPGGGLFPLFHTLSQNYPNPFNAQTTIQYFLPWQSMVSIDIFDIFGRKIETLAPGMKSAGDHQAVWDANGRSSGVYFYSIKAGDYSGTKRMLLIK